MSVSDEPVGENLNAYYDSQANINQHLHSKKKKLNVCDRTKHKSTSNIPNTIGQSYQSDRMSVPPPPPGREDLWELQFCRWWGWNWVKKREEATPRPNCYSKQPITMKRRERKSTLETFCENLCLPIKHTHKCHHDLKRLYDTPRCSTIYYSQNSRGDYCPKKYSTRMQCEPSYTRKKPTSRRQYCRENFNQTQSWINPRESSSSEDEYCCNKTTARKVNTSAEDCIQYLTLRMEHVNSDQNSSCDCCCCCDCQCHQCCCCCCDKKQNKPCVCSNIETQTKQPKKSCKCAVTQTVEQKCKPKKKKCKHFVCHQKRRCCHRTCCPCNNIRQNCCCHCEKSKQNADNNKTANGDGQIQNKSEKTETEKSNSPQSENFPTIAYMHSEYFDKMLNPWAQLIKNKNKNHPLLLDGEFRSPVTGKVYNLNPVKMGDTNSEKLKYLDPIDPQNDLKHFKKLLKSCEKSNSQHGLLLNAVCDALLSSNKNIAKNDEYFSNQTKNSLEKVCNLLNNCYKPTNFEEPTSDCNDFFNSDHKNGSCKNNEFKFCNKANEGYGELLNDNELLSSYQQLSREIKNMVKNTNNSSAESYKSNKFSKDYGASHKEQVIQKLGVNTSCSTIASIKQFTVSDLLKESHINNKEQNINLLSVEIGTKNKIRRSKCKNTKEEAQVKQQKPSNCSNTQTGISKPRLYFENSDNLRTIKRNCSIASGRSTRAKRMRTIPDESKEKQIYTQNSSSNLLQVESLLDFVSESTTQSYFKKK